MKITIIGINEITEHVLRYIEDISENIVIYDMHIPADFKNKYKSKNNITIIENNYIEKDLFSISEEAERLEEQRVKEEQQERERLDRIYEERIRKEEEEKLIQLEEAKKIKEKGEEEVVTNQQKKKKKV